MKIEQIEQSLLSGNTKKNAIGLIHRVYLTDLKNARIHTAFTKTKSEVRGGGRKPWRQKGTGNARAGSSRSPLFVGGGAIFGPKPRIVSKKVNKKEKRLALLCAFMLKKKNCLFFEESLFLQEQNVKTKFIVEQISKLGANTNQKLLLILSKPNKYVWLATRNVKNIELVTANCFSLGQLLHAEQILLSQPSLETIYSIYGKQYA